MVPRKIQDIVYLSDVTTSLDKLIEDLTAVREKVGQDASVELWGDQFFGQKITVRYYRLQTEEEIEIERRYNERCKSNRAK